MELLEGATLGSRLGRGPLSLVEAMTLARRIAAPLAAAHEGGIVHRDLKPDNVFLVRDPEGGAIEQVKLLDFGIAKLESVATPHLTTIGAVLGTPSYMAPEQCLGTRECDARVDLYALGCILFEMLCGRTPYADVPTSEVLAAHVQRPVPDITKLVSVPSEIAHLVTKLLAKSPDDRPRSAADVVVAIDRWLAPRTTPPRRRGSLRAAIAAALGIAISLSSIGAWYRWWRHRRVVPVETSTQDTTAEYAPVIRMVAVGTDAGAETGEITAPLDALVVQPPPDAAPRFARGSTPPATRHLLLPPAPAASIDVHTPVAADVVEDIGSAVRVDVNTPVEDP
jgi:serine/threonine protein kinase